MSKHPTQITIDTSRVLSPAELAMMLSNLRYDALSDFLYYLSSKLKLDSDGDLKRDRKKLACALLDASVYIKEAADVV